jgi:hypothetical protein
MCPSVLFVGSELSPPRHEKYCIDVSRPRRTKTQYVTHRSHLMQNHKFSIMCPSVIFWDPN